VLINCHAHVFNLQSALTDHALSVFRERIRRELQPEALGNAVADVIVGLLEDVQEGAALDDREIVRKVVEKLSGEVGFGDLRDRLPEVARRLLGQGLGQLENALVFRLVDQLDRLLDQREGDAKSATVTDALALLRLALQTRTREVALRLFQQLGPDRGAVALMIDITDGSGTDDEQFDRQTRDLTDLVLTFPGRFFPFFAVNTLRPDHRERLVDALTTRGFVGVKLYPALGYRVDTPEMKEVLRQAADLDAPLLSHTTPSGFYAEDEHLDFGDPAHWPPLLEEIPGFRICFAHFGASRNLTKDSIPGLDHPDPHNRWTARILDMMRADDEHRVFTDVSYHTSPMESDAAGETNYFRYLKDFLGDGDLRDQILFGTDFWLVRMQVNEGNYWRFFQHGVDSSGLTELQFRRMAETNNHRFLGLPLAGTDLPLRPNMERYVDFVHQHRNDLESKPAPWLLDALRERHGEQAARALEARQWPLADTLEVPGWRDLVEGLVQDVLDTAVSGAVGDELQIADASFGFDSAGLGFQGDGRLSLAVFNRTDQFRSDRGRDPDGVLGLADGEGGRPPAVVFDPGHAWVKYRAEGHLELRAQGGLGAVGLEGSAEKTVVLTDYRRHERETRLRDVVPGDLRWPRFALTGEDVLRLEPGDAVSFQTHGRLAARVTASWADVFSFGLTRLARALEATEPLGLEVNAGVSVSGALRFEDDFRVVFARTESSRRPWRVEVRKAETRGAGVSARLGLEVAFTDPKAVTRAVGSLLSRRLQAPLNQVQALLGQSLADLGPRQRRLFDEVAGRLGVGSLAELETKIGELQQKAMAAIHEIVRERLEVGFTYEYSRVETDTALLVAELDERAVETVHGSLVRGDFTPLLEWDDDERDAETPDAARAVKIREYVLTEEEVTRKSWGFSLNFGRWLQLTQRDVRELLVRRQRNRLDSGATAERLTYLGSRGYTAAWTDGEWSWEMDLDARMDRTSPHDVPRISDFTYGLGFHLHWESDELSEALLDHVLDAAALWGVLPAEAGGQNALRDRFDQALRNGDKDDVSLGIGDLTGREVEIHLQLLFDQVALARTLPRAKKDDAEGRERIAQAMGAAMPLKRDFDLHSHLLERRRVYGGLFARYLEDARSGGFVLERRLSDYQSLAESHLRTMGHPVEARQEDRSTALNFMWTFAGMLSKNLRTAQDWRRCLEGLEMLAEGVGRITDRKHSMIKGMFHDLAGFWGQTHHVRTLGAYLLDCARVQGMPEGVAPSLRVELTHEGKELAIPIGPGAG